MAAIFRTVAPAPPTSMIPGEMAETGCANVTQTKIAHLSDKEKQRYYKKIDILGFDPYLLPNQLLTPLKSVVNLPNMSFGDIYIYLVHNPSPYSGESLKAYKSTEAYMYFKSGWVNDPRVYHLEMKKLLLFTGKVRYLLN